MASGKFEVKANAPGGPTFTPAPARLAGAKNTKRKAAFGINCGMPHGTTFQEPCKPAFDNPSKPAPMKKPVKKEDGNEGHSFKAVGTK
jgi:hypothetical protein